MLYLRFFGKCFLFIAFIPGINGQNAFSQSGNADLKKFVVRSEYLRRNRPAESVYIHFDKPYYAAGDTIWFKTYVTLSEAHKPTPLSQVVQVDLITPQRNIINSIRLKLKQGTAYADFELPDTLPAGIYRIRAYTRWMLNEGGGSFFDQKIAVGSNRRPSGQLDISARQTEPNIPDIGFFPEGGELLTGVETKVAFKSIGPNGLGLRVKGIVVDNDGNEITSFRSAHLGMGFFYLTPKAGKSYRANLNFGDGSNETVDLPKAMSYGMVLSIDNGPADSAIVNVLASRQYFEEHQHEYISLLIYAGGVPSLGQAKLDSPQIGFAIDKRRFPSGIMRITLLSTRSEPVSERLLFIQNPDHLDLEVKGDKQIYGKRGRVEISLDAKVQGDSAAQGNFSVSVINEDIINADENKGTSIFSNLLLTSELNGYIEQPNYYFTDSGDDIAANLDILMLTHGYRHFLWKQILADSLPSLQFKAETSLQLQGIARTLSGKPMKYEKITLSDPSGRGPELTETADSAGQFVFRNLEFTDTTHFTIAAEKNASRILLSGSLSPQIVKDSSQSFPDPDSLMMAYLKISARDREFKKTTAVKVLKPVTVTRKNPGNSYYTESLAGAGNADQVFHGSELKGGGLLTDQIMGRLRGVMFVMGGIPVLKINAAGEGLNGATPMLVIVDGVKMKLSAQGINDLNPTDVETIEVLRSGNASMYGMEGGSGVLIITTRRTLDIDVENGPDPNAVQVAVMGFYKAKEFYSPKYLPADTTNPGRDLRTTVFWKPDLITGIDGHASFSFYNSDLKGTYKVVVEGIDADGKIGRQVYRYKVQ